MNFACSGDFEFFRNFPCTRRFWSAMGKIFQHQETLSFYVFCPVLDILSFSSILFPYSWAQRVLKTLIIHGKEVTCGTVLNNWSYELPSQIVTMIATISKLFQHKIIQAQTSCWKITPTFPVKDIFLSENIHSKHLQNFWIVCNCQCLLQRNKIKTLRLIWYWLTMCGVNRL